MSILLNSKSTFYNNGVWQWINTQNDVIILGLKDEPFETSTNYIWNGNDNQMKTETIVHERWPKRKDGEKRKWKPKHTWNSGKKREIKVCWCLRTYHWLFLPQIDVLTLSFGEVIPDFFVTSGPKHSFDLRD